METSEKLLYLFLTILLTAFFASLIPRKLKEREKRNEAIFEFRKIFNQALVDIHVGDFGIITPVKDEKIKAQHLAYLNFRYTLRGQYQRRYDEAWKRYYYDCKNLGSLGMFTHITRKDLEKDINHLLEFTKYSVWKHLGFIFHPLKPITKEEEKKLKQLSELYEYIKKQYNPLP